jgi:DNA-binding transcriptional ArsR family regulator
MVESREAVLDRVFKALGDPTRRRMLGRLTTSERAVSDLAGPFDMTLAAASKHLAVLERAGLVRRVRRGRARYCSLTPKPLVEAQRWLDEYRAMWEQQFDKLDAYLARKSKMDGAHG